MGKTKISRKAGKGMGSRTKSGKGRKCKGRKDSRKGCKGKPDKPNKPGKPVKPGKPNKQGNKPSKRGGDILKTSKKFCQDFKLLGSKRGGQSKKQKRAAIINMWNSRF